MSYFDDASLVMIPSGYKTDKVYSVKPTDGTGDLTFTRSNDTATRVGPDGLIEKVRTNQLLYSQDFSNAAWAKSAGTTLTHSQTDPNGGTTASRLQMPSGTSNFLAADAVSPIENGGKYTHSVYMKSNTGSTQSVRLLDGVRGVAGGALLASVTTSWQRFEVVITTASTSAGIQIDNQGGTYNNDILIAFAQIEASDFGATPYIPTTSAAVSVGPVANVPRLDYLGSSCPRLILEPQTTSLVTFSEQMDNAAWAKTNASITANAATSPDGYASADKLVDNSTNSYHLIESTAVTATIGTAYTFSVFSKAGEKSILQICFDNNDVTGNPRANFDLQNGVLGSVDAAITATITDYGSGWYRCTATATSAVTSLVGIFAIVNTTTAARIAAYVGNGTDGLYLWGANLTATSYPQSYIPTLGAAVTRGADACVKTGISSLIGQTEGTLFAEIDLNLAGSNVGYYALQVYDSASSPTYTKAAYIEIYQGKVYGYVRNTTIQGEIISSTYADGTRLKIGFGYKANDFVLYVNGIQIGVDTSGSLPSVLNALSLHYSASTQQASPLSQALLFPTRLSNADLAALTA